MENQRKIISNSKTSGSAWW